MLITLTTDFGTSDWFVGAMKGVISGIAPATRIIDITHKVPPGDLVDGAFALSVLWYTIAVHHPSKDLALHGAVRLRLDGRRSQRR